MRNFTGGKLATVTLLIGGIEGITLRVLSFHKNRKCCIVEPPSGFG